MTYKNDTDSGMAQGVAIGEEHIYKTLVLCHIVVLHPYADKERGSFVGHEPSCVDWDGDCFDGYVEVGKEETVIGVIPASPGTYRIEGEGIDHIYITLGYEYPGVHHPDWVQELIRRRQEMIEIEAAIEKRRCA